MKLASICPTRSKLPKPSQGTAAAGAGSTIISQHEPVSRDGQLVIVNQSEKTALLVPQERYPSLRAAIEDWDSAEEYLRALTKDVSHNVACNTIAFNDCYFLSPLPRSFALIDASAFLSHIRLVRRARGAPLPAHLSEKPLLYQSLSDGFLEPNANLALTADTYGLDFEAEIAVVLSDVALGISPDEASRAIKLVMLMNDVTYRNLIPSDLESGFGFFHSKPASSFAPFAVTSDELGDSWDRGRLRLPVTCTLNGKAIGSPDASEMHFSFPQLIASAAQTRSLRAGTILGSGTVSNESELVGVACLAERRAREQITYGETRTPYLQSGDRLGIEVNKEGHSVFGAIEHLVTGRQ